MKKYIKSNNVGGKKNTYIKGGPGAGYSMNYKIYDVTYKSSIDVDVEIPGTAWDITKKDPSYVDLTFTGEFSCLVDLSDISSYYYSAGDFDDQKAIITKVWLPSVWAEYQVEQDEAGFYVVNSDVNDDEHISDYFATKEEAQKRADELNYEYYTNLSDMDCAALVEDEIAGNAYKSVYGGGWIHSTWDGTFAEIDERNWSQFIDAHITDQDVIDYVDKAVQGENIEHFYELIVDDDYDALETFEDEDEAREAAQNALDNGAEKVQVNSIWDMYDFNGDYVDGDSEVLFIDYAE